MFTDIINKEAFEFTCKTESIASQVQRDIESHTIQQLNHIIDTVFSEAGRDAVPLKIDKIEIDLGDIHATEIGNDEVISRFRNIFRQKIIDAQNLYNNNLTGSVNAEDILNVPMQNQNELELIRSLIETGDVPWWVDKNNRLNIDSIVQSLVNNDSGIFRELLEEHKASPELLSRLFTQIKPRTFSKVKEWLPGLSNTFSKEIFADENTGVELNTLSVEHKKNLKKNFEAHAYNPRENSKYKLADSLIQLLGSAQKNQISFEGSTLEHLLRLFNIGHLISATKNYLALKHRIKKNEIAAFVHQLTIFEVELLLFEVSRYLKEKSFYYSVITDSVIENFPFEQDNYTDENIPDKEKSSKELTSSIKKNNTEIPGNNVDADNGINEQKRKAFKKNSEIADLRSSTKQAPGADNIENKISFPDKQETSGQNYKFNKMIEFIMKRLKTSNLLLFQYLQKLDKNQLEHLTAIFKKRDHEKRDHKQTVNNILEHPFLFQYNILDILKYLSAFNEEYRANDVYLSKKKKLKNDGLQEIISSTGSSQESRFFSPLKKLPGKDFFIIKDILQKGRFDTESEKNVFKKILHNLSHENILLLKFLTELSIEEIEQILPAAAYKKEVDRFPENKPGDKREKKIYIENAGLCLLSVYLPHFFNQLKYLENGKFKNIQIAVRAIYILQYLVSGKTKTSEYLLQFNKLICSFHIEDPIATNIHLTKREKLEADNLITAVIRNWKSLKNTSAKGLRKSFLQRKGILSEGETTWILRVEKKGYDLLLDAIPWSYNIIKFPWMKKIIQVEW